jgi:peptidoglycan hydrolase-like protein with peptidoglycan-binding domain
MADPILRAGMQGPSVRELQTLLNARLRSSPHLPVNGCFGVQTC